MVVSGAPQIIYCGVTVKGYLRKSTWSMWVCYCRKTTVFKNW